MLNLCFDEDDVLHSGIRPTNRPSLYLKAPSNKTPPLTPHKGINNFTRQIKNTVGEGQPASVPASSMPSPRESSRTIKGPTISMQRIHKRVPVSEDCRTQNLVMQKTSIDTNTTVEGFDGEKEMLKKGLKSQPIDDGQKTKSATRKLPHLANTNRIPTKNKSIAGIFLNMRRNTTQFLTSPGQIYTDQQAPQINILQSGSPRTFSDVQQHKQNDFLQPGFDPRRVQTIYSYQDEPQPQPQLVISQISIIEKRPLKLGCSSKCKLVESNVDGASHNYVIQESIVDAPSVLENFRVLSRREVGQGLEVMVAVERNIEFIVSIKRIIKDRVEDISNQMLFYRLIGEGHPNVLEYYQSVLNQNVEYLMLKQYYEITLADIDVQQEMLPKLVSQLLAAFEFFMKIGLLVKLFQEDVAVIGGVYKICGFRSYSRCNPNDPQMNKFYCNLLGELVRTVMQGKGLTNILRDFLETLSQGMFCPAALRLHAFLSN